MTDLKDTNTDTDTDKDTDNTSHLQRRNSTRLRCAQYAVVFNEYLKIHAHELCKSVWLNRQREEGNDL